MSQSARRRVRATIAALLTTAAIGADAQSSSPCVASDERCIAPMPLDGGLALMYYRTHAIDAVQPEIQRVIIVVHGAGRDADRYFGSIVTPAQALGVSDRTLVIAPQFRETSDKRTAAEVHWSDERDWRLGDPSANEGRSPVSSFDIMDRMIQHLAQRKYFPGLKDIVIAGHSAGAQYVQRYAAGSQIPSTVDHLSVRYVVANPSSYLYFGPERVAALNPPEFSVPNPDPPCAFNTYKYGLDGLNAYMSRVSAEQMRAQYRSRQITYLLGGADTDPTHRSLDKRCEAKLQGESRFDRGQRFKAYLGRFMTPHQGQFVTVAGVGHEGEKMFGSTEGRSALFPSARAGHFQGR